jgi:subtilisin family serine protease
MARRAHLRMLTLLAAALVATLTAGLMPSAAAGLDGTWLTQGRSPVQALTAVDTHSAKLPPEFQDRLQHALPDGTLMVMVAIGGRGNAVDRFVEANTTRLHWLKASPGFLATVTPDQLTALLNAAFVTFVEPDYPISFALAASAPDVNARATATTPGLWSFDKTEGSMGTLRSEVPGLTADQTTGKGVTVAVIDSGIDKTHRDFGGWDCAATELTPCQSRVTRTVVAEHILGTAFGDTRNAADDLPTTDLASGHGTHVAGTIAGNGYYVRDYAIADPTLEEPDVYGGDGYPIGIAPQANLINIKNGDSQSATFGTAALDWLAANAQQYGVRVASNSWGCLGGCTFNGASATNQTFKALYNAGVVVTFAAGNDGGNGSGAATTFSGNAQSPYVLGVASYDYRNHQLASSSSRGQTSAPLPAAATWTPESEPVNGHRRPDVAAPGVSVWAARNLTGGTSSTVPRQNSADVTGGFGCCIREYAQMSGTSMATPHVSGAAALLVGACPSATSLDVMRAIMVGADANRVFKTGSTTALAQPFEVGYGGLDVRAGLDWLMTQPACSSGPINAAPVAGDDTLSLNQGSTGSIDVLANDTDADGDVLSIVGTTDATAGDVEVTADGVTYTPDPSFFGSDSFEYAVTDPLGATDTGLVTIDVNGRPSAIDDTTETNQGSAVSLAPLANDSDPEGDAVSITSASAPAHGSVAIGPSGELTYTPDASYHGTDSFEYEIVDANGASDVGVVSVAVNGAPVSIDDSATAKKKGAVRVDVISNDSDPEGHVMSLTSSTQAAQGTVDCSSAGTCTYLPNGRYKGMDSFTYAMCDAKGACDRATVRITVGQ